MKNLFLLVAFLAVISSFTKPSKSKVEEAFEFSKVQNLDTGICIFINMSEHSGKKRMFLYDFAADTIIIAGLVSHGCGKSAWSEDETKNAPVFSNLHESHCSSLGKYKIGNRGWSNWGIHVNYKLHGLEETNSNAFDRQIVLHSWGAVTNEEIFPMGTSEGYGCPAVSNDVMKVLDKHLKTKKNVLMWIYK